MLSSHSYECKLWQMPSCRQVWSGLGTLPQIWVPQTLCVSTKNPDVLLAMYSDPTAPQAEDQATCRYPEGS